MLLNLGCGTKTSNLKDAVNIDWSIFLRLKKISIIQPIIPLIFKGERLKNYKSISNDILVHNLKKGIPFKDNSVDAIFHSHVVEHIDRDYINIFINESYRVLKPGGILRIVCPDLHYLVEEYLSSYEKSKHDKDYAQNHDRYVSEILEQCVRKEANGSSNQKPFRRKLENFILGSARDRGETHQWMYDDVNLKLILEESYFKNIKKMIFNKSNIENWEAHKLESNEDGSEFKPHSLYLEAIK